MLPAVALICLGAPAASGAGTRAGSSSCPGAGLSPSATNATAVDAATLCLIDRVRAAHHLRPLRANRELQGVAARQAACMVRWDYFADECPSGQTAAALIAATPYGAHAVRLSTGQNVGWGTGPFATPAQMVTAWMASPAHRAIILTRTFNDAGVGMTPAVPSADAVGERGATYALELAARRS